MLNHCAILLRVTWLGLTVTACGPKAQTDTGQAQDTGQPHSDPSATDSGHGDTATNDTGPSGSEEPCDDPTFGVVTGHVYEWIDEDTLEPQAGAWVVATQGEATIQASGGDDASYQLTLPVGQWQLQAQTPAGDCFSTETPTVDVTACASLEQDLVMDIWAGR
jgi:hypothetical protein